MRLAIFGSEGGIGSKLRAAFPDAIGIDRAGNPDLRADLDDADLTPRPSLGF